MIVFGDFCKAFDSISYESMFKILKVYGIPDRLVSAVRLIYDNLKAKVSSPDGETDYFKIYAGVMQGDTLAPFLFVIVLDYALRKAIQSREEQFGFTLQPRRSKRIAAKSIRDLDFTDDIVLLSNEIDQARALVHSVEEECLKVGLRINSRKTKAMYFNVDTEPIHTLEWLGIKRAITQQDDQDFKYLGSWCNKDRDIQSCKALAWKSLHKLNKVWTSGLSNTIKLKLFHATTETILTYGSSSWSLTTQEQKSLDGTYTRMLRKMCNINWRDKMDNKTLYESVRKRSDTIIIRRLKLAGHVFRDKSSPAHLTVTWMPAHGYAQRGRPKTSFIDNLLRDTNICTVEELKSCMRDRDIWRDFSRCQQADLTGSK